MRHGLIKLLIATLLFVSMEGVAEPVDDSSVHHAHHSSTDEDVAQHWLADGGDHENDDCNHFCHAHVVALASRLSQIDLPVYGQGTVVSAVRCDTRGAAPPIPPPNI